MLWSAEAQPRWKQLQLDLHLQARRHCSLLSSQECHCRCLWAAHGRPITCGVADVAYSGHNCFTHG